MKAMLAIPALGVALVLASAPRGEAASAPGNGRACFRASDVSGFSSPSRDQVDVQVTGRRQYRLTLVGDCPATNWAIGIGIRSRGGGSLICEGRDAELIVPDPLGPRRCHVTGVRRLSAEEIAAERDRR